MARKYREIGKAGWGYTAITAIISFIYFSPVFWIILTAFKTRKDALAVPPKLFFTPTLDNFASVFYRASITTGSSQATDMGLYFFNSIFIAFTSVGLAIIVGTLAAYAFSRFPLRGNDTYLFIILTTRMMPPIVVIIPIFLMFRLSGLAGSYWGIIFLYTAFNIPFSVWLVKSFFDELNPEIEDAARMDGASERRVFFGFCIPQILAGLSATFVFGLILTWNEFLFALLLTGVDTRTVPVAMARTLGGEVGVDYGLLAAIVTLFLIPIFFVTFLLQNQLLRGVTFGTVKK
jgi:multiple sugar transport system permease protein